jgi:hypothetical protein
MSRQTSSMRLTGRMPSHPEVAGEPTVPFGGNRKDRPVALGKVTYVLVAIAVTACGGGASSGTANPSSPRSSAASPPAAQPTKSTYLSGTASPTYPAGGPNQIAVVAQAPLVLPIPSGGETVPIAVRNNTTAAVTDVTAVDTVRDAGGHAVASGSDQGFHPALLQPGQVALGFVYLGVGTSVPSGSAMTVQASAKPSSGDTYFADLLVTEANNTGQQIVGTVKNPRNHEVQAPFNVDVFCLAPSGALQAEVSGFADVSDKLAAGATSPFTASLYSTPCQQFLIGASGYDMSAAGN